MSDVTQINREFNDNETVINREIMYSQATVLNREATDNTSLPEGTVLLDKYKVTEKIPQTTGEASIYICEYKGEKYAAKIYHRERAVKPDVVSALEKICSKHVARLYDFGIFNGKPVEVMQYFGNGSIQGKKFSLNELKTFIIPGINEGLRELHKAGIIHKDLKPSNIMMNDDGKSVAIIDFGISSVEENGNTVIVTKTGMTPEYSAPESYRGLFLDESDYYSFGITLYELFCGRTPYKGLSAEQIAQYTSIQRIPLSDDMPQELKDLITALTYYDITNRNDKKNPNRRWTYEEVKNWCSGKKQAVPGESMSVGGMKTQAYKFMGQEYSSMTKLTGALTSHWEEGKKQLFRGLMSGFFKNFDPEIAGYCLDAEEAHAANTLSNNVIYFRFLYKLSPDMISFNWKGRTYENISALGRELLDDMREGRNFDYYKDILENNILSEYLSCTAADKKSQKSAAEALENTYRINKNDKRQQMVCLYSMGYLLSGQKSLTVGEKSFSDVSELVSYMNLLLNDSYSSFEEFCGRLINSDNELDAQLESWLIALGNGKKVSEWKAEFVI